MLGLVLKLLAKAASAPQSVFGVFKSSFTPIPPLKCAFSVNFIFHFLVSFNFSIDETLALCVHWLLKQKQL
jgi:hypothetical protein